jgi:hypothetical protein
MQGLDVKPHFLSTLGQRVNTVRAPEAALLLTVDRPTRETVTAIFFFMIVLLLVYAPSFSGIWIYDD